MAQLNTENRKAKGEVVEIKEGTTQKQKEAGLLKLKIQNAEGKVGLFKFFKDRQNVQPNTGDQVEFVFHPETFQGETEFIITKIDKLNGEQPNQQAFAKQQASKQASPETSKASGFEDKQTNEKQANEAFEKGQEKINGFDRAHQRKARIASLQTAIDGIAKGIIPASGKDFSMADLLDTAEIVEDWIRRGEKDE